MAIESGLLRVYSLLTKPPPGLAGEKWRRKRLTKGLGRQSPPAVEAHRLSDLYENLHQGGEREAALRAAAGSGVPPEAVQLLRTPAIWQLLPEVPGASPNEPTNEEERTARVANFFVAAVTDLDVHPGASAAV
eukprot:1177189-Prorocentrum_minimum.AAC.6